MLEKDIDEEPFTATIAVDDISFIGCEMPRPTEGECGEERPFQCKNKVVVD